MNQRKYAFILLFLSVIQDAYSMQFLSYSSPFITNVINNKWFVPAILTTSLVISNAMTHWFKNQQVIAAKNETDEVKNKLDSQKKEFITMQQEWVDLLHRKGVDTKVLKQPDQPNDRIEFINVSQDQLNHLVAETEKAGYIHSKEHGHCINARALELGNQLKEVERQKQEAMDIEKALTKLAQDEIVILNGKISALTTFFKLVKTNIVVPDEYEQWVAHDVFKGILELPLTKSANNNDKCAYFYNDPESYKRKIIISLESQRPPPPSGFFSPPLQRHNQSKG